MGIFDSVGGFLRDAGSNVGGFVDWAAGTLSDVAAISESLDGFGRAETVIIANAPNKQGNAQEAIPQVPATVPIPVSSLPEPPPQGTTSAFNLQSTALVGVAGVVLVLVLLRR